MIPDIQYREGTVNDATAVAEVLVASWKESFAGIVPDSFLKKLTVEELAKRLRDRFSGKFYKMFVAETPGRRIVGFADVGLPRHDVGPYDAELHAIFLFHEVQGKGIGRELFQRVKEFLISQGKTSMYLLGLEVSPYRPFYEKMGGRVVGKHKVTLEGFDFDAVAYGWERLV